MYSRLVVPLVCAAAIVFACGPRTRTSATPLAKPFAALAKPSRAATAPAATRRGDTVGVAASFGVLPDGGGVRLALQVVNLERRRLEIDFPDGRTRDFVIYDANGREVWRWSRGRLFTQTVQNKFLAAGDTAVYSERWSAAAPGQYTAVAVLRSRNFPVERRVTFAVHPAGLAVAALPDGGQ